VKLTYRGRSTLHRLHFPKPLDDQHDLSTLAKDLVRTTLFFVYWGVLLVNGTRFGEIRG
jgi:hypothetical protein